MMASREPSVAFLPRYLSTSQSPLPSGGGFRRILSKPVGSYPDVASGAYRGSPMKSLATRRMYRRLMTNYPSCYHTSHSFCHSVVRDISLNGLRIKSQTNLSRDAMVMVRLWLPDQQGSLDIDQAVVRWVRGQEFGVQFVSLSNEADFRLATHIEQLLRQQTIDIAV